MTASDIQSAQRAGRLVGLLLLVQMIATWIVNFVLEPRLFGTQGFLVSAAPHASQIGIAVVIALVTDATWLAIAVIAFPILSQHRRRLGLWLVALGAVILTVSVVENGAVLSMVSLSKAYLKTSLADRAPYEALRVAAASSRNWPHFLARLFHGISNFVLYAGLYQLRLIPRALAVFGQVAAAIMIGVFVMVIFGSDVVFPLLAPMGLSQLILVLWLITRGFRTPRGDTSAPVTSSGIVFV